MMRNVANSRQKWCWLLVAKIDQQTYRLPNKSINSKPAKQKMASQTDRHMNMDRLCMLRQRIQNSTEFRIKCTHTYIHACTYKWRSLYRHKENIQNNFNLVWVNVVSLSGIGGNNKKKTRSFFFYRIFFFLIQFSFFCNRRRRLRLATLKEFVSFFNYSNLKGDPHMYIEERGQT